MNIGIVGCGLIGRKRADAVRVAAGEHRVVVVCDVIEENARKLANHIGSCEYVTDYKALCQRGDIDLVVVSTPNYQLAPITLFATQQGKHVIVEKPGGVTSAELEPIMRVIEGTDIKVKVGFNHRYHPALQQAKAIVDSGEAGPIMFIRGRYGHGGRVGYDKEWRADPGYRAEARRSTKVSI